MNYIENSLWFHIGAVASLIIGARYSNEKRVITFSLIFIGYCIMIAAKGM